MIIAIIQFVQFKSARRIPSILIKDNKSLSGHVVKCYSDSVGVCHVPLGKRILRIGSTPPGHYTLNYEYTIQ